MKNQMTQTHSMAGKLSAPSGNADASAPTTGVPREITLESTLESTKRNRMPMTTRRAHARAYREEPVQYSIYNSKKFHDATMYNESTGGMYFETEMRIAPGTDICIRIHRAASHATGWANNACTARVRWCRQLTHTAGRRFGIGVQYHKSITQ